MRIGLMIEGQEGLSWERWRDAMAASEELGFDSLWRSDHLLPFFGDPRRDSLETWVSMAVAAQETSRVRLGVLVCPVTFRHPALLARMAAQVDMLSGGRLEVGVGAGWNVREHEAFGFPFPPTKTRLDMLEDTVQILRALWGPGPTSFKGRCFELTDAECYPKPAQERLPIVIGGAGEKRTLPITAKYADHWNAVGVSTEGFVAKRELLDRLCEEAGRDPREVRRSKMSGFVLGRDAAGVRRHLERLAVEMTGLGGDPGSVLASLRGRGWLTGTADEVVEQLHAYEAAGCQEFMMQHLDIDNREVLEVIANDVIPNVRGS